MSLESQNLQPERTLARWLAYRRVRADAVLRLFCFPYAGGSATAFRGWDAGLPSKVELCAVQLPGRESRLADAPFTRMVELVGVLAQVLHPVLDRPFALFGHSIGARVAFELARRLRALKMPQPVHLFVSGSHAPHLRDPWGPFHVLPDAQLIQELRGMGGTPEEILEHNDLMRLLLPVLRADFELNETYIFSPNEALDCRISAFSGLNDTTVPREAVEAWREHTRVDFNCRIFDGGHFFIHESRELVLQVLRSNLQAYF